MANGDFKLKGSHNPSEMSEVIFIASESQDSGEDLRKQINQLGGEARLLDPSQIADSREVSRFVYILESLQSQLQALELTHQLLDNLKQIDYLCLETSEVEARINLATMTGFCRNLRWELDRSVTIRCHRLSREDLPRIAKEILS